MASYFGSPYGDLYGREREHPYGEYTPQDQATVLDMAKSGAMSGMELLSDILDTFGGRAIKGLLGGKPREALSFLPGSDYFKLTDPTEKVTGADLAKQWGLTSGNRWGDLATGIGIDLLTDPTTYLFGPGAALTKGGQIAKAAGILPKTVRARQTGSLGGLLEETAGPALRETLDAARAGTASLLPESTLGRASQAASGLGLDLDSALSGPLGGLAGFGLPLSHAPAAVVGTGEYARRFANVLGAGTDLLGTTLPFRAGRAMFNRDVEGRLSGPLQEGLLRNAPQMEAAKAAGEGYGLDIARQLEDFGMRTPEGYAALGKSITGEDPSIILSKLGGGIASDMARRRAAMEAAGVGVGEIEQYLPRSKLRFDPTPGFEVRAGAPGSMQGISPVSPHLMSRVEPYASVPGTGEAVDLMFQDPRISSPFRTLAEPGRQDLAREANIIRQEYLGWTPAKTTEYGNLQARRTSGQMGQFALTPEEEARFLELDKTFKQGDEWAGILSRADPKHAALSAAGPTGEKTIPFYDPDVVKNIAQYTTRSEQVKLRAEGIMHAVGKDAVRAADAPLDWISVPEVFNKIGMTGSGAQATLAKMMQDLGKEGANLADLKISRSLANDLTSYVVPFSRPTALDPFIKTWDTIQTIFKAGVMTVFPKKYIRDAVQGGYMNFATMSPAEFAKYSTTAARFVKSGSVIDFANQVPGLEHLSPEQATLKLADEFHALDGFYTGKKSRFAEEAGGAGFTPKELPGSGREGVREILTPNAERPTTWNPLDIAGVAGREETKFAPVVAGGKISELIDETNKFTLFLQRRMNGSSPGAAWEDVLKRHYDFANLTGFERSVMRRVVPFYSWMRQNTPATLKRLIDQPGGVEALTAKAANSIRSGDFIPEYAAEGLAIPVGQEEGGVQRFLGKGGLQFEDTLKLLGDIGNSKLLGNLTPALKVPLEFATGTQLHTGRPLEDLEPVTGNRVVDEILANSGLPGRALSTIRPFISPLREPRLPGQEPTTWQDAITKGTINALAPMSITDVDMEKQRQRAVRQVIEQQLKGAPNVGNVERFYVKPENVPNLTPAQQMLLRVYGEQQSQAAEKRNIGVKRGRKGELSVGYHLD